VQFPGCRYLSELLADSYHDPTYENIVNALQEVCENAKKGDFINLAKKARVLSRP